MGKKSAGNQSDIERALSRPPTPPAGGTCVRSCAHEMLDCLKDRRMGPWPACMDQDNRDGGNGRLKKKRAFFSSSTLFAPFVLLVRTYGEPKISPSLQIPRATLPASIEVGSHSRASGERGRSERKNGREIGKELARA